jgi:hypothetical protein
MGKTVVILLNGGGHKMIKYIKVYLSDNALDCFPLYFCYVPPFPKHPVSKSHLSPPCSGRGENWLQLSF